jgi:predicted glycosyltransferase
MMLIWREDKSVGNMLRVYTIGFICLSNDAASESM